MSTKNPKAPVWRSGPPPSIGWWPASRRENTKALRWWDGKCWSYWVWADASCIEIVAERAAMRSPHQESIRWTDRPASWPKRSRT